MKKLLPLLLLLFFTSQVQAAEEEYLSSIEGSDVIASATLGCTDPKYNYMQSYPTWVTEFDNIDAKGIVSFSYLEDDLNTFTTETHTVDLTIQTWDENGSATSTNITLSIDRNNSTNTVQSDIDAKVFDGAHRMSVIVNSISGPNTDQLIITSKIQIKRLYFFDYADKPNVVSNDYNASNNDDTKITWNVVEGAEAYDLEWVFIDDYEVDAAGNITYMSSSDLDFNFYLQGTRVRVKNNYYHIPKMYSHGYFVYRLRAVGRHENNYDVWVEGLWTLADQETVNNVPGSHSFHITSPYSNDQMNWQWSSGFSEDSKRFDAVSFSDGLGRGRQSIARDNENEQVIVSNQYYDYQGRPAVTDLPSPNQDNNELIFKEKYNRAPNGTDVYSPVNFDEDNPQDPCLPAVDNMHTDYGSSNYYSVNNPDQEGAQQYVPDAKGYPFKRVEYTPDNTGRIAKVSAYGENFTIESDHTIKKNYASVMQGEIVRFFGTEVGFASNYTKTYTTDPNGQASVTYYNQNGQVIAAGLVGSAPNGIDPLTSNTGAVQLTDVIYSGSGDQTEQNIGQISISKTFYAESDGNHSFSYEIAPEIYTDACLPASLCFDCVYDLEIILIDNCGDTVLNDTATIGDLSMDSLCQNPAIFEIDHQDLVAYLYAGQEYYLYKNLKVSEQVINESVCDYLEVSTCVETYQDFFNDVYTEGQFANCGSNTIVGSGGNTLLSGSYCDRKKAKMLLDVSPGGQYGQIIDGSGSVNPTDLLSVYNTSNVLTSGIDWRNPAFPYEDASGNPSYITIGGVQYTPDDPAVSLHDFYNNWEDSWAKSLLDAHPERCYLDVCYTHEYSFDYDDDMRAVETFDEACSLGFLDPTGFLTTGTAIVVGNHPPNGAPADYFPNFMSLNCQNTTNIDPAYSSGNWANWLAAGGVPVVIEEMNAFWRSPDGTFYLSVWELAFAEVMCPGTPLNDLDECDAWDQPVMNDCQKDAFWRKFRDYYFVYKGYKYRDFIEYPYAVQNECYNGCIGVTSFDETINSYHCTNKIAPATCSMVPSYYNSYSDLDQNCNSTYGYLYEDKSNVFPHHDASIQYGYSQTYANTLVTNAQNNLLLDCADECDDMADQWMIQLMDCNLATLDSINIRAELVELCSNGCDVNNPWGTSTVPSGGTPTANGNKTFHEVLEFHLGSGFEDELCSDLLISDPRPHGQDIDPSTGQLDTCGCDKVLTSVANFSPGGGGPQTLEEQFLHDWGFLPTPGVSELECACSYAFDTYAASAYQPGDTWPSGSVTELENMDVLVSYEMTCPECVTCADIATAKLELNTRFDNVTDFELSANYMLILENYMNHRFDYHLAGSQFDEFIQQCNATPQDPYCHVTPEMKSIIRVLDLLSKRGDLTVDQPNTIDLSGIIPYQYSDFKDVMDDDDYWTCGSSCSPGTLEMNFGSLADYCKIIFDLPSGADFDFDDIIAIYDIAYDTVCGTSTSDFTVKVDYYSCGVLQTATLDGYTDCYSISECICDTTGLTLCNEPLTQASLNFDEDCYENALAALAMDAAINYNNHINAIKDEFTENMMEQCKLAFDTEEMEYTYFSYQYQFTLYYYNQVGNLVKTVPPKGLDASYTNPDYTDDITNNITDVPAHNLQTEYRYNSYGQLVASESPDGGMSSYWYDVHGRTIASQNAEQLLNGVYTYVFYDEQGRVKEVGHTSGVATLTESIAKGSTNGFVNWVESGTQFEITRTFYDRSLDPVIAASFNNGQQENLRLRIATVAYYLGNPVSDLNYAAASHYSYDPHGNVKEFLQDVPSNSNFNQAILSTEYDFDLISGVMKEVVYESGEAAQFIHKYYYDENNRLKEVYTSAKDIIDQREANYSYYEHGPTARVEKGDFNIQGEDYIYTINGWLKGMNSNTLDEERDPGNDGTDGYLTNNPKVNSLTARDAVGFTLRYFDNDYGAIGGSSFEAQTGSTTFGSANNDLYNGNISSMVTAIQGLDVMGYSYTYDQLHRLKEMNAYEGVDLVSNSWSTGALTNDYFTAISYDDNGNITSLERNGLAASQLTMDNFTYNYNPGTNQLDYVDDGVMTSPYEDIKAGQVSGNYKYDAIGRLIYDDSEDISLIEWREDSKVKSITNSGNKPDLTFLYDPMGQRIMKVLHTKDAGGVLLPPSDWRVIIYARDASGNVMAEYESKLFDLSRETKLKAHDIYGSGRLGRMNYDKIIYNNGILTSLDETEETFTRGNKYYELTNHLGNVLTTVSDRKIHHPITTSMYFELSDLEFTDLFKIDQDPQTGVLTSQPGGGGSSCGAASTYNLSGDGYIEWNVGNVTIDKNIFVGLSYSNYSSTYDMDYSWYISNGPDAYIFENSGLVGSAYSINDGDILKIERDGSLIKYYKNGTLVRTITESGTGNLLIDISMLSVGKQIQDLVLYDPNADYAYYTADQISYSDYYAFGMQMPGRQSNPDAYTYGFNGMRKDAEVSGEGNSYDFGARMYNPRLGRFFSPDPIHQGHESPYNFAANNPIYYVDLAGKDNVIYLIFSPTSLAEFKNISKAEIVSHIQQRLKDFGLKTKVVIWDEAKHGHFNPWKVLDPTDAYVRIGGGEELGHGPDVTALDLTDNGGNSLDIVYEAVIHHRSTFNDEESDYKIIAFGVIHGLLHVACPINEKYSKGYGGDMYPDGHSHTYDMDLEKNRINVGSNGAQVGAAMNKNGESFYYIENGEELTFSQSTEDRDSPDVNCMDDLFEPSRNKTNIKLLKKRFQPEDQDPSVHWEIQFYDVINTVKKVYDHIKPIVDGIWNSLSGSSNNKSNGGGGSKPAAKPSF